MTRLVQAMRALQLDGEVMLSGRWIKLRGDRCAVYVIEASGATYYTWCDDPKERWVQRYLDPTEAIQAGLRRAARSDGEAGGKSPRRTQ